MCRVNKQLGFAVSQCVRLYQPRDSRAKGPGLELRETRGTRPVFSLVLRT